MGCGASAAPGGGEEGGGRALKTVSSGDIDKAIATGRSGLVKNQRKAVAMLLSMVVINSVIRERIASEGGIYPLVAMLKSKSKDVQRNAAKVLSHLATEQPIRVSIVDEGAITPLLDLLLDPVAENSMAACKALLNIAVYATRSLSPPRHTLTSYRYVEARSKIVAEGAMPRFVKLLGTQVLEDELMLLHTTAMLSQHPKNHIQLVRDGILPRIFTVLRSPMKSVKHKHFACVALSEVCTPLDNHRQICEEGGLNAMVALCGHFSEDVRSFAALAVERLGENSSLRRPLAEAGVVPPLVMMLSAKKMFSQKNAALALGSLAQDPLNQIKIVQLGGLDSLMKLSRCGVDELEATATRTLGRLAQNNINRPRMLYKGAFKPLVYNAQYGSSEESKTNSKTVLSGLFKTDAHKRDSMVRKAADKFKALLKKRGRGQTTGAHVANPGSTFAGQLDDD